MSASTDRVSVRRHCTAKLGVHRGAIAAARVAQWAMTTADLGHLPTTVEYADWWAMSERNAWRHRSLVHEAFGDDWATIVDDLAAEIVRRKVHSSRGVQALAVPA